MIILGAFTLLLAVPSFAQEKSVKAEKTVKIIEEKSLKHESSEVNKVETSEEQLNVVPEVAPAEKLEINAEPKKRIRVVEPVENRKLIKATPTKED